MRINNKIKLLAALFAISIAGVALCCSKRADVEVIIPEAAAAAEGDEKVLSLTTTSSQIWVYVLGAVNFPGVYCLEEGSRAFEALELAGGFTKSAVQSSVNLAQILTDGQQLYIRDLAEGQETDLADFVGQDDGRININTASLKELMTLTGIGEVKAQAIIDYRQEHPFNSLNELMNVSGIKQNLFEKIKDDIVY